MNFISSCRDHSPLLILLCLWMTACPHGALPSGRPRPQRTRTQGSPGISTMRLEAASHPRITTVILARPAPPPSHHSRNRRPCPTMRLSSRRAPSRSQWRSTNLPGSSSKVRQGVRRAVVVFKSTKHRGVAEKGHPCHPHSRFWSQVPPIIHSPCGHRHKHNILTTEL